MKWFPTPASFAGVGFLFVRIPSEVHSDESKDTSWRFCWRLAASSDT
jgi:hypothetical protein